MPGGGGDGGLICWVETRDDGNVDPDEPDSPVVPTYEIRGDATAARWITEASQ